MAPDYGRMREDALRILDLLCPQPSVSHIRLEDNEPALRFTCTLLRDLGTST